MLQTVAIVFISDLVLRGKSESKSCRLLLHQLNLLGFEVKKVSFINENEKILTCELDMLSKHFDIIIVVGEFNKIIFKALASVTHQDLVLNESFKKILNDLQETSDDMCWLPLAAKLLTGDELTYPVVYIQRIFILKEEYVEQLFLEILKKHLGYYRSKTKYTKEVHVKMNGNTKEILGKINNFNTVHFKGSSGGHTLILESFNFEHIVECETILRKELCQNFIESREKSGIFQMIYKTQERHIQQAIENIEKCFATYGPENVFLSFNGGKDCTVLLHLVHTVLNVKYPNNRNRISCLYVKNETTFPEQDEFISLCEVYYNLELMSASSGIKTALNEILSKKPNIKACFMGTRRTDPYSNELSIFQMTDPEWPQLMRVSPLLEWHYSDIWDYLLYYKIPYCKLYDYGFTSLGSAKNTIKNSCLVYRDMYLNKDVYLPAYKLLNESEERNGRNT